MKILVTGGSGFIGSHVVDSMLAAGHRVSVFDRVPVRADVASHVESFVADLRDKAAVNQAVVGIDAVCHQAAKVGLEAGMVDAAAYAADNDLGTAVLLGALDGAGFAGRLVLASSMVVYGEGSYLCAEHGRVRPPPRRPDDLDAGRFEPTCPTCGTTLSPDDIDEDDTLDPRSVYAATKLHQEHLCSVFGRQRELPVTALRYHNVYGPRMPLDTPYAGVAALFRACLLRGEAPLVFEDGGQRRDFIHVADVARANLAALTTTNPYVGALNIATGVPHTVADMAETLAANLVSLSGAPLAPEVTGTWRKGDVRHVTASPARAGSALGFTAEVSFEAGMKELAEAR